MVAKALVFRILLTLAFLCTVVSSGSVQHGVLSKLYQKAIKEQRPLVLVLDPQNAPQSETMREVYPHKAKRIQKNLKQTSETSRLTEDGDDEISMLKTLIKKVTALVKNRKITLQGPKKFKGLKAGLRTKEDLVAPLLRSLLRVSNDMNCAARDECEVEAVKDECDEKFECVEEKQGKVDDECDVGGTNDCVEEKEVQQNEGGCGVGDVDECEGDEIRSTKGYLLEPEIKTCTRC